MINNKSRFNIKILEPIQDYCWIKFIKDRNSHLLELLFSPKSGAIFINSIIDGKPLKHLPKILLDFDNLTEIKIKYNQDSGILSIKPNNAENKVLSIQDFKFSNVITYNIATTITEDEVNSQYTDIIDKIKENISSLEILDHVIENNDSINQFIGELIKDKNYRNRIRQNKLIKIAEGTNSEIMNILKSSEKNTITYSKLSAKNGEKTVILQPQGKIDETSYWVYTNNMISIVNGSKLTQYIVKNNLVYSLLSGEEYLIDGNLQEILETNNLSRKLLVLVICCFKNINKIRIIKKTWGLRLSDMGIPILFVLGDPSINKSFLNNDILYIKSPDDYESLPKKIYEALFYVYHNLNFEYILKIDDDCVLSPTRLLTMKLDKDYLGVRKNIDLDFNRYWHSGKCKNKKLNNIPYPLNRIYLGTWHAKGESGYLLSKRSVKYILTEKKYIYTDIYEDKAIGDVLRKHGILLQEIVNYKPKLYKDALLRAKNLNMFNLIVDVPEDKLITIYNKISI